MCGIGAIFKLNNQINNSSKIDLIMETIKERGPDSYQKYSDENIDLGHRRLSIIDPSPNSNQPFIWDDRYIIVFNGAIYNYLELRSELEKLGYKFNTKSDTEVLIASYCEWGTKCLNKLNGMWAFIIWDKVKQELFASRDRFGIKPLYWAKDNSNIFFASEIKHLRYIGIGKKLNVKEISKFIYTGIIDSSIDTCFKNIKNIPAGYYLKINKSKKLNLKKWYFLNDYKVNYKNDEEIINLLIDSIRIRTRGDVNIGTMLSGGIDSSVIAVELNKLFKQRNLKFKIFHGESSDQETNESYYARYLCKYIDKELIITKPTFKEFSENIEKVCYLQDQPFGSSSIFMQYFVINKVKNNNCKILLDGQGADELLLGYKRYLNLPIYNFFKERKFKKLFYAIVNLFKSNPNIKIKNKIEYIFGPLFYNIRILIVAKRLSFLNLPLSGSKSLYKSISINLWDVYKTQKNELFKTSLPSLLRFADRNSMANGIELRLPYLDYRFVEKCIKTNIHNKINKGWEKFIIRNSRILPEKIAWRSSKLGFASPQKSWTNKFSEEMLKEVLKSNFYKKYSNLKRLRKKWRLLRDEEKWRLFNVAIWFKVMDIN